MKYTLTIITLLLYQHATSCTCLETDEDLETKVHSAYESTEIILAGSIYSIQYATEGIPALHGSGVIRSSTDPIKVSIIVSEIFKGIVNNDTIEIITAADDISCGYPFKKGLEYIVYIESDDQYQRLYSIDNLLTTNLCTRTKVLSDESAEELELLKHLSQK